MRAASQRRHAGAHGTGVGARNGTHIAPDHLLAGAQEDRLDAKKKRVASTERDEAQREAFRRQLSQIAPHNRVSVDEAGVDDTLCYPGGWSPRTTRCFGERLGQRTPRVSLAAAWCCGEVFAPLTFEG